MSKVDKQALRELAEKATPGAWGKDGVYVCTTITAGETIYVQTWNAVAESHQESNAQFIAAANPATILALLDEIEWLKADAAATREAFSQCVDSLHAEMLGKYHGQSPEDMHPVVRRDYDQDVLEVKEYREIAEPDGCQGGADHG